MSTGSQSPTTNSFPSDHQQQEHSKQQQQSVDPDQQTTMDEKQHSPPSTSSSSGTSSKPTSTTTTTAADSAEPAVTATIQSSTTVAKSAPAKITVLLKAAGNAPILKNKNWNMDESNTVAYLVLCLRKILHLSADQSLFVFVNQSFSPTPEHTIGTLHQCFGGGSAKLTLHYSTMLAWG